MLRKPARAARRAAIAAALPFFLLSACDVSVEKTESDRAGSLTASDIAGTWILGIDTSEAARQSLGEGDKTISVSIAPSSPAGDGTEGAAPDETLRHRIGIETADGKISRCVAQDLDDAGEKYVTVACSLEKGRLTIALGSEENGGVIVSTLAGNEDDGTFSGKTILKAKGLPIDVTIGRARLSPDTASGEGGI
ncbi:MAG: hypothetical protein Tsb008_09120 [Rhodothalassiaceae bacterium]